MKTCTWTIKVYFDDEKKNLMIQKTYKNIEDAKADFTMKKNWYFDIFRRQKRKYQSYKTTFKQKYQRIVVEKLRHTKEGDILEVFSI
jgi:3'-phosphoadenosine 5'-phosphosulfate sulfotransferase